MNWKAVGTALALMAIAYGGYLVYENSVRPPYWEAREAMKNKIDREHKVNAVQLGDESEKIVARAERRRKVTDSSELLGALMPSATRARDLVRTEKAWDARAGDRDEMIPQAEVLGNQSGYVTVAEIRVPTRIFVDPNDMITPYFRPGETTNADGRPFNQEELKYDRTVLMQERYRNVRGPVPPVGNVNELIGRFCDNGVCRSGLPLGTDSVICAGPGLSDGGIFQAGHNGLKVLDQTETDLDFANGRGKFRIRIQPDRPDLGQTFATDICNAHPGALVVKKPKSSGAITSN